MSRARRVIISFTVVLVSYWGYLLLAVPLIEPPAKGRADLGDAPPISDNNTIQDLAKLFPAGAWQTQNPAILENGQAIVLFTHYQNMGNGRIEINPCTVVYTPAGPPPVDDAQRLRRKVILDTVDPTGKAILQFDKPVEFGHGEMGRLVGGQLIGNIIIRSEGNSPGPEDDLWLATQNVNFNERRIWTIAEVEFRYGPSHGHGREMDIGLSEPDEAARGNHGGTMMGDLETFELRHVDLLHLEPQGKPRGNKMPGAGGRPGPLQQDQPVEITCQGPFDFDLPKRTATFHQQVDVLRLHPNGPSDHLSCELLTIFLAPKRDLPKRKPRPVPGNKPEKVGLADLEARRVEAEGEPVTVLAPSDRMQARGGHLIYDVWTGGIVLEGGDEVWMQQDNNEIHGASLQYTPAPDGRLGQVDAAGPGWFRGQMSQRGGQPGQPTEARWSQRLEVRPDQQKQVISLHGNAVVFAAETGQLKAQEVHFALIEQPAAAVQNGQQRFQPDHMWADKEVELDSPQMTARVEHMEVCFEPPPAPAAVVHRFEAPPRQPDSVPAAAAPAGVAVAADVSPLPHAGEGPGVRALTPNPSPETGPPAQVTAAPAQPGNPPSPQHFEVQGRTLWARMMLHGQQQAQIIQLIIEQNVHLVQTQTAQPDEKPVVIVGDRIEVKSPSPAQGIVTVLGQPARFEGQGLTLTGTNLNLDRGANHLWVDGPGTMDLPMDRMPNGFPAGPLGTGRPPVETAKPSPLPGSPSPSLEIRWYQKMDFDGRIAIFLNQVSAIAPQRQLNTEYLEVQFRQPIAFTQGATRQAAELERITCRNGVLMEASTMEGQQLIAKQQMQMADFTLNLLTGAFQGNGRGSIVYTSRGNPTTGGGVQGGFPSFAPRTPGAPKATPGGVPAGRTTSGGPPRTDTLTCLQVTFDGMATGNVQLREATFHDWVKTAYAPVTTWEATLDHDRPESLGPQGMTMDCDQLSVLDMPTPLEGKWAMEMTATGNVRLDSLLYSGSSSSLKYSEAGDRMILEGNGRTDAQLWRHLQLNSSQTEEIKAQWIEYHPSTNRTNINGFRGGQMR